jgi:hypothetical protein
MKTTYWPRANDPTWRPVVEELSEERLAEMYKSREVTMASFILDGQHVTVKTAAELVDIMHANSFAQAADDQAYMEDVAERTVLQDGAKIRTTSPEAFVNDLVAHGLIKPA